MCGPKITMSHLVEQICTLTSTAQSHLNFTALREIHTQGRQMTATEQAIIIFIHDIYEKAEHSDKLCC